ncbi:hypothetical protein TNCV_4281251 [Trichonephila clavipes]|nr:hypothetical protein TNCV_4281251 [Trichonephila clavipes]
MDAADFFHHENSPTWAGIELTNLSVQVKLITEAASSYTSLIKSSEFDKPAALAPTWKAEYLVPLIVNKSSYETTPFFSRNDSSPGNRSDIFLRELAII